MNPAGGISHSIEGNHARCGLADSRHPQETLKAITLHRTVIDNLPVRPAERPELDEIPHRFQLSCRELGTIVHRHDGALVIVPEDGKSELTP